jgi:hypothetical protein
MPVFWIRRGYAHIAVADGKGSARGTGNGVDNASFQVKCTVTWVYSNPRMLKQKTEIYNALR